MMSIELQYNVSRIRLNANEKLFPVHRRWRLPWSRSRGPAPSPDSNYGFHTQTRTTEANVESGTGPYSVLNSQSSGPYSVLNTQNAPYTPSTASYSVLETPVPLWGPPPPYSDPNSPARRPQVIESRARIAKRMDNFENNEGKMFQLRKKMSSLKLFAINNIVNNFKNFRILALIIKCYFN